MFPYNDCFLIFCSSKRSWHLSTGLCHLQMFAFWKNICMYVRQSLAPEFEILSMLGLLAAKTENWICTLEKVLLLGNKLEKAAFGCSCSLATPSGHMGQIWDCLILAAFSPVFLQAQFFSRRIFMTERRLQHPWPWIAPASAGGGRYISLQNPISLF